MPKGISRNPRTDKRRVKNRISKVKPSKAELSKAELSKAELSKAELSKAELSKVEPNFVEVGPPMTFKQAMDSVRASDASMEHFTRLERAKAQARKQQDAIKDKLADLIGLCSLHDIVKMLAEQADDKAYETQDHDDDLLCMVLAKTEKQIWGLTLSQQHRAQQT